MVSITSIFTLMYSFNNYYLLNTECEIIIDSRASCLCVIVCLGTLGNCLIILIMIKIGHTL